MYLCFDLGGTNFRLSLFNRRGKLLYKKIYKTPGEYEQLLDFFRQFYKETGYKPLTAIGGGLAGPLDYQKKFLNKAPNLKFMKNKPLKEALEKIFKTRVLLDNDATLGGLAEAVFGAGKNMKIIAYLAVGTGVGGVKIVNQKIEENSFGFEPGHQIIKIDGKNQYLEDLISGKGIELRYGIKAELLNSLKAWRQITDLMAVALNNLAVHWSPDIIVLGGSVFKSVNLVELKRKTEKICRIYKKFPKIKKAELKDNVLFGAYYAARNIK